MDQKTKEKFSQDDSRQRWFLLLNKLGNGLAAFARHGLWPIGDTKLQTVIRVVAHGFLLLMLYGLCGDFLIGLAVYVGLHALLWIVGAILGKIFGGKLVALGQKYQQMHEAYYRQQCEAFGIRGGCVVFQDGTVVGNGDILALMRTSVGFLQLYQLEDSDEDMAWFNYKLNLPRGTQTINDHIASLEFKRKFALVTRGGNDREWLKFLSPTVQMKMIKSKTLGKFLDLHIDCDKLFARTKEKVKEPSQVDTFDWKRLSSYFEDVDTYCRELRAMAERIYKEFQQIDFMLG